MKSSPIGDGGYGGYIDLVALRTSRPKASRVRIRMQVLLQSSAKLFISASWGFSDGGRGCWALPSLKSPKFMALVVWLVHGWGCLGWRYGFSILFEVPGLFAISCVSLHTIYARELRSWRP